MSKKAISIDEVIRKCLYTTLDQNEDSLRYRFLNFIYTGKGENSDILTPETYAAIGRVYGSKKPSFWLPVKELSVQQLKRIGKQIIEVIKEGWNDSNGRTSTYYKGEKSMKPFLVKALIASESPPFKVDENERFLGSHLLGEEKTDKSGPYYSAIRSCFENENSIAENLLENNVLFFDILPIPLPVDSELRKKWSTSEQFYVDDMPLSAWLFKLAIDHYSDKYKCTFDKNTNVALMMPTNTSIGIFLQAKDGNYLSELSSKLRERTTDEDDEELLKSGITPPRYKANVMGSANTPSNELLKRKIKKDK